MNESKVKEQSNDTYDPGDDPQFADKMELIEHIKSVVGTKRHREKPLNIVVLGCPGSGKSALLNTIFTSFRTDCWAERARVGDYGECGEQQVTTHVLRYTSAEDYYPEYPHVLLPTFIDVQGLDDANCAFNAEFLRGLFNGKIRDGQCMREIRALYDEMGKEELRRVLEDQYDQFKVDGIIVVVSADPNVALPCDLLQCIHGASRLKRRMFSISCMFTLKTVVSPHLKVINAKTGIARNKWSVNVECFRIEIPELSIIVVLQMLLLLIFVRWLLFPCISFDTLNTLCANYSANKDEYAYMKMSQLDGLDTICSDKIKITPFSTKTAFLYLMLTFFAIPKTDLLYNFLYENTFDKRKYFVYAGAFVVVLLSLLLSRF